MRSKVKVIILLFIALSMGIVFGCGISDGPSPEAATDPAAANKVAGISSQNSEGLALYASKCAGCHGNIDVTNIVVPTSFSDIRSAISSNMGGMRVYAAMSDAEVQAIAEAINDPNAALLASLQTRATPPASSDGAAIYASRCAACHRDLASSNKIGTSVERVQNAIAGNVGGMGSLSTLTALEIQAVVAALNSGGSTPALSISQSTDGATLYATNCAGCHGALGSSTKKGITLSRLQNATNNNIGGMGFLSQLTATQEQAIVAVLSSTTPSPTTETDGVKLYNANCAGCHGALASSGKAGATTNRIQSAITGNIGNMGYLSMLSATQVAAIASVLTTATPPSPTDGPGLYAANCASCHRSLAKSEVRGDSANDISEAIRKNKGGMGILSSLTSGMITAIANALKK